MSNKLVVKIYHGFGHTHDLHVFGHVLRKIRKLPAKGSQSVMKNAYNLMKLFFVEPIPQVQVTLSSQGQTVAGKTEDDGFFKFDWESQTHLEAGWHPVQVSTVGKRGAVSKSEGEIFVPHITQYGFISDIDDTVLISHSATIKKRLRELFVKRPEDRTIFEGVAEHYSLLAHAHTEPSTPNPFFYVSSSEWNLYDYLQKIFKSHKLPEGVFLLNQIKRWHEVIKSGKTKHEGKLLRILRVLKAFPNQQFVLLGDNSQMDPEIYRSLVEKYPERVHAVYIRNVSRKKEAVTIEALASIRAKGKITCFFRSSKEAIEHSRSVGLIQ